MPGYPVSHVNPGDGFYQYVNHSWLKGHHIHSWDSEFGASDEIQESTDKELLSLLRKPKGQLAEISDIWTNRKVDNEETYIKICVSQLITSDIESISRFFGWMCKSRIKTVVQLVAQEETVSPWNVRASLTPGSLTLPVQYYLNAGLQDTDVWKAYSKYITTCSIELGLPFLHHAIEGEIALAKILDSPFTSLTKRIKGRNMARWSTGFEWNAFMEGLDFDVLWHNRLWLLDAPDQLKGILHWFCTVDTEQVVAVLALHCVTFGAAYLRPAIRNAMIALFHGSLQGVSHMPPEKYHFLNDLKVVLPEALSDLYASAQHNTAKLRDITALVESLRTAAVNVMEETTVLSKKTLSATKEKIRRMKFNIGTSTKKSTIPITFNKDSLLHTIISIQHARVDQLHSSIGKPSSTITDYPCFIVNASYFSESNQIVLPWGILQSPFYSYNAPVGWNHGGIGATIAHEMTHAFDLEGSLYSPRATFREWWTRKDRNRFKQRTRKLGKFFSGFKHYGVHVDGKKTLSEDWADFGGITIALRALKDVVNGLSVSDKKEAYKQFFMAYAVSWRTLVRKKKMLYAILTSVHAPAEDRVDRIVPQFQEWVDAFDVKEGNKLYLPPGKRLKFF